MLRRGETAPSGDLGDVIARMASIEDFRQINAAGFVRELRAREQRAHEQQEFEQPVGQQEPVEQFQQHAQSEFAAPEIVLDPARVTS
jgi:hypothetical protein